jgi:peptidoglycan L-alanyl-D-glutamate endopeptidase CwlK
MDVISENRIALLHPKIRHKAFVAYREAVHVTPVGVHPFITEGIRSFKESDEDYAQGRTKPGPIISYAKGGQSYHNYGLAVDFVILINGKMHWIVDYNWMKVVECFKKQGFTWGGDWPHPKTDPPHLEMTFGYNWRDFLAKYNAGQIDDHGYIII